ncbi:MAG: GNAT family N-acetyltransferase [Ferruginibacter sp.]
MKIYEVAQNEFMMSTDKKKLDIHFIQNYLCNESYWAKNIPPATVVTSIEGSLCFGLYVYDNENISQVGFARVITDHATFAYLADVFIIEKFRGNGLSKWMMKEIMDHPELQGLRRWLLATKDAHGLYAKFGFLPLDKPERIMGFKPFEEYPKTNS